MRLLRSFPVLSFLVVLTSIIGVGVAQRSIQLLFVAGMLAILSWYVTEGPRGRSLPRWVSNLLVIAVSLFAVFDVMNHPEAEAIFGVVGRFCVWLSLVKLYERKTTRDHANLLLLSLLMMLSGCLQSADLIFGVVLLIYAGLGLYALLLYQLYASYEQEREIRAPTEPTSLQTAPAVRPVIGRRVGLHFRLLMTTIAVAGIALSVAVFMFFPRKVGQSLLSQLSAPTVSRRTAFSPEVNLMSGGRVTTSKRSVAFLQVHDANGEPAATGETLWLRGAVLGLYEGAGSWKPAPTNLRRLEPDPPAFTLLSNRYQEEEGDLTLHFDFRSGTENLFTTYAPMAVRLEEPRPLTFDPDGQIMRADEDAGRIYSYDVKVRSQPDNAELRSLGASRASWRWQPGGFFPGRDNLHDPEGRVRQLAVSLLTEADLWPPPRHRARPRRQQWNGLAAQVLTEYLQSGEFTYTLDTSDVVFRDGSEDPIVNFLFESKKGHCEHFASALVALCQSVEIESRMVVGYLACIFDEQVGHYHIVESNAHAWCDVRTDHFIWTEFDPTPPATLEAMRTTEATFADRLNWMYQSIESTWSSNIVDFDYGAQTRLATTLEVGWAGRLGNALTATREWLARVNRAFYFGSAGYIWMGFVGLALVIAVLALIKLMRRSLAIRRTLHIQHLKGAEYQRMIRQLGFYVDMLLVLHKGKLTKPPWQPPLAYARAIADDQPQIAETVHRITDLFYAARYGQEPLDRERTRQARTLVHELARMLRVKI